jgi:hypothetical protein
MDLKSDVKSDESKRWLYILCYGYKLEYDLNDKTYYDIFTKRIPYISTLIELGEMKISLKYDYIDFIKIVKLLCTRNVVNEYETDKKTADMLVFLNVDAKENMDYIKNLSRKILKLIINTMIDNINTHIEYQFDSDIIFSQVSLSLWDDNSLYKVNFDHTWNKVIHIINGKIKFIENYVVGEDNIIFELKKEYIKDYKKTISILTDIYNKNQQF